MEWTDIGPYGSEISTPNIDKLAKQGVSFMEDPVISVIGQHFFHKKIRLHIL